MEAKPKGVFGGERGVVRLTRRRSDAFRRREGAGLHQPLEHRRALYTENIRRFARGLPLLNLVDKAKGY